MVDKSESISESVANEHLVNILPPIGQQEIWAAGVTYLRSRNARIEESIDSGGANLYDRVYEAERPELFFKSLPHRVADMAKRFISEEILYGTFQNQS
jgi:2-dehydro-3-deoxy-D-arabinonate dehydratase